MIRVRVMRPDGTHLVWDFSDLYEAGKAVSNLALAAGPNGLTIEMSKIDK